MPILTKSKQKDAATSVSAAKRTAAPSGEEKKSVLSKPLGAKKSSAVYRGRTPTKQSINLATIGVKRTNWLLVILTMVLILVAAGAIGKFLVYDRLQEVTRAQNEANAVLSEINVYRGKIEQYGELNDLFAHYTYTGMTDEEHNRVDRVAVLDLIQGVILPRLDVSSWSIASNKLKLSVQGNTLQEINLTAQKLMEDELVDYCEVNTASTGSDKNNKKVSSEKVSANMVVYLVNPEEVAEK